MLITDEQSLVRLCRQLSDRPYVAVDTEFVGEHSYWPNLCLVQVAAGGTAAAIDPVSGLDLAPLFEVLSDPRIVKVFHSARQDLAIFRRLSGRVPAPVFDTQVAAMACGFGDAIAYSTLVSSLLGVTLSKALQVTDWSRRPLTAAQLDYALADVVHLGPVYEALAAMLAETDRAGWIDEETARLMDDAGRDPEPEAAWQRIPVRGADGRTLAVLREMAAWREEFARELNVPRARVARDETLLDIAFRKPGTIGDLRRVRGFANVAEGDIAAPRILRRVGEAMGSPASGWPQPRVRSEIPEGVQSQVSLLQALLRARCEEHGVAQKLVATRADLEFLVADPSSPHPVLRGWRAELFGNDALALLRGDLAITGHANGTRVVEIARRR